MERVGITNPGPSNMAELMDHFMAHTIRMEQESAAHYEKLAFEAKAQGFDDIGELFTKLGHYSFLHLTEAHRRAERLRVRHMPEEMLPWPDYLPREQNPLTNVSAKLTRLDVLQAALLGEKRGFQFYDTVAKLTHNPEVRELAQEFIREEQEHVQMLEDWIANERVLH